MLNAVTQRWLKVVHVLSAGVWLGALTSVVWLFTGIQPAGQDRARFGIDLAVYHVHETVLFWAFVATLTTGLIFSLFTRWGFFEHHWLTAKWIFSLGLFALTLWVQSPAVSGMVALSDAGLQQIHGQSYAAYRATCLAVAVAQLAVVVCVFALSVVKPWGRRKRKIQVNRKVLLWAMGTGSALAVMAAVAGYLNLQTYRTLAVSDISAAAVADGEHSGVADCGFVYRVTVVTRERRIEAIRVVANRDAHYAKIAEAVLQRIVQRQNANVDTITGATTTSRCLMRAVDNALTGAREPP